MIAAALLPLLAAMATASPTQQETMMPKHSLPAVPSGWALKSAAPADLKINMQIALKEQNLDKLQQRLLQISNPDHADYGKHMSRAEVEAMTAPSDKTVAAVTSWLASHGVTSSKVSNGFIKVDVTVSQAQQMLGTEYGVYHNADKDQFTVRTTEYSLPKSVHSEIAMIQPTTMFSNLGLIKPVVTKTQRRTPTLRERQSCGFSVTPSCLQSLYNINYTPTGSGTSIGIAGYLKEVASQDDLSSFLSQYGGNVPSTAAFSVELVNGGSNTGSGTVEADLDTQCVIMTIPRYHSIC